MKQFIQTRWQAFSRTPFGCLLRLFVARMFHGGGEPGAGELDLGIGVLVIMLAMPGILVSLLMFEKYGSLIRYLRGHLIFDPYTTTMPDEFFFIVLSLTVTGAAALWRWDALFLDRRDYTNLVPLPLSLRAFLRQLVRHPRACRSLHHRRQRRFPGLISHGGCRLAKFLCRMDSLYPRSRRRRLHRKRFQLLCRLRVGRAFDGPSPCHAIPQSFSPRTFYFGGRSSNAARQQLHRAVSAHETLRARRAQNRITATRLLLGSGANHLAPRRRSLRGQRKQSRIIRRRRHHPHRLHCIRTQFPPLLHSDSRNGGRRPFASLATFPLATSAPAPSDSSCRSATRLLPLCRQNALAARWPPPNPFGFRRLGIGAVR